ncbi:MAG: hypothetical protein ACOY5B_12385 [Spirochaetota bacterium]
MITTYVRNAFIILATAGFLTACIEKPRTDENRLQRFEYRIGFPNAGNAWAKERALEVIRGAKFEIVAVFNDLNDSDIAQALIDASNRKVRVGVGGDQRNENQTNGFQLLKNQRSSNRFLDQRTANQRALAAANKATADEILRTRLNFNRQNRSAEYNASPYDGRVEYNFITADSANCWLSTGGANPAAFSSGGTWTVSFYFQSNDLCRDLTNEGTQLAFGGLFGDEGKPAFGTFRNSKAQVDPNFYFRIDDLAFYLWFAPQERPSVPVINELLRAEDSIYFGARALTQDIINDVQNHSANRSHILNALEYKARLPAVYGKNFTLKGVIGNEGDSNLTSVPNYLATAPEYAWHKWNSFTVAYNTLVSSSCPTVNGTQINVPYESDDTALGVQGFTTENNTVNLTSIHCDLQTLRNTVNGSATNTSALSFRRANLALPFNAFLIDKNGRRPRVVLMSSDLRRRYYFDSGNVQDAEPKRTRNDYYAITDAFVLVIEPAVPGYRKSIFDDFEKLLDDFYAQGVDTW